MQGSIQDLWAIAHGFILLQKPLPSQDSIIQTISYLSRVFHSAPRRAVVSPNLYSSSSEALDSPLETGCYWKALGWQGSGKPHLQVVVSIQQRNFFSQYVSMETCDNLQKIKIRKRWHHYHQSLFPRADKIEGRGVGSDGIPIFDSGQDQCLTQKGLWVTVVAGVEWRHGHRSMCRFSEPVQSLEIAYQLMQKLYNRGESSQ